MMCQCTFFIQEQSPATWQHSVPVSSKPNMAIRACTDRPRQSGGLQCSSNKARRERGKCHLTLASCCVNDSVSWSVPGWSPSTGSRVARGPVDCADTKMSANTERSSEILDQDNCIAQWSTFSCIRQNSEWYNRNGEGNPPQSRDENADAIAEV